MLLRDKVVILSGMGPGLGVELAVESAMEGARHRARQRGRVFSYRAYVSELAAE